MDNKTLVESLKASGIKPSVQRIVILDYLKNELCHPNIDTIFQALKPKVPTLSKATVYNTLSLFEEKGLVKSLYIEPNEVRYDINTHLHGHFKCEACQKVSDVGIVSMKTDLDEKTFGGVIYSEEINIRGLCGSCAALHS